MAAARRESKAEEGLAERAKKAREAEEWSEARNEALPPHSLFYLPHGLVCFGPKFGGRFYF